MTFLLVIMQGSPFVWHLIVVLLGGGRNSTACSPQNSFPPLMAPDCLSKFAARVFLRLDLFTHLASDPVSDALSKPAPDDYLRNDPSQRFFPLFISIERCIHWHGL
jgi:hypothetical protein